MSRSTRSAYRVARAPWMSQLSAQSPLGPVVLDFREDPGEAQAPARSQCADTRMHVRIDTGVLMPRTFSEA